MIIISIQNDLTEIWAVKDCDLCVHVYFYGPIKKHNYVPFNNTSLLMCFMLVVKLVFGIQGCIGPYQK